MKPPEVMVVVPVAPAEKVLKMAKGEGVADVVTPFTKVGVNGYEKGSKPVKAEQMTEPCALVVSAEEPEQDAVLVIARLVVVAWARVVFPTTDSAPLALRVPPTLRSEEMVEEPFTASEVEVAPA